MVRFIQDYGHTITELITLKNNMLRKAETVNTQHSRLVCFDKQTNFL
jgi:hypothetical protein